MASIDKTYLTYSDYLILKEWCENTELIYDNGVKGSPKDFLCLYNEPYEEEKPVWNTPEAFDKWLYHHCPLSFIQERLKEQYHDCDVYFNLKHNEPKVGIHYRQISIPKIKYRNSGWWYISCSNWSYMYGEESHMWYSSDKLMPSESRCSTFHTKNLTKHKLNRLIKKWKLPVGTILNISNRWIGSEYQIKIC